jgi:hypothetical protein
MSREGRGQKAEGRKQKAVGRRQSGVGRESGDGQIGSLLAYREEVEFSSPSFP